MSKTVSSDAADPGPLPAEFSSISVIVPAYNEARRLPGTLDTVATYVQTLNLAFVEIIVVDDGSSDGTDEYVRRFAVAHPEVRLVRNPGNRGKGYAVRHGVSEARGVWILMTDADLSSPVEQLIRLAGAAARGNAQIAIGSRALERSLVGVRQGLLREFCGRLFNVCVRLILRLPYKDTQCGFKLFRTSAATRIFSCQRLDGFSFDVEALFLATRLGFRTVEVPVRWNNVEGSKVSGLGGVKAFWELLWIGWFHGLLRFRETGMDSARPLQRSQISAPDDNRGSE